MRPSEALPPLKMVDGKRLGALLGSAHLWHWVRTCGRGRVHNLPIEPDEA